MAGRDASELWSVLAAGLAAGFSFMGTRCCGAAVLARSTPCVLLLKWVKELLSSESQTLISQTPNQLK